MQPVPLESTSLASVEYDPALRHLQIQFRSGERYLFFQVPPPCYQHLLQADSKGAYFNRYIRNCFPYQCLSHPAAPIVLAASGKTK
jgi:KTSC domain